MSGFPNAQNKAAGAIPVWVVGALAATFAPKGYEQITDLSTAVGLTVPAGAVFAILQGEAQVIRYRDDGTDPTTSVGMILYPGSAFSYNGPLADISLIEVTSGAILNVLYYGAPPV